MLACSIPLLLFVKSFHYLNVPVKHAKQLICDSQTAGLGSSCRAGKVVCPHVFVKEKSRAAAFFSVTDLIVRRQCSGVLGWQRLWTEVVRERVSCVAWRWSWGSSSGRPGIDPPSQSPATVRDVTQLLSTSRQVSTPHSPRCIRHK